MPDPRSTAPRAPLAPSLPADVRDFLALHRYAVVATVNADGSPQQAVVWYLLERDADGADVIVVNSREGRRWPTNLRRDPRISVAIEDGLDWVGLTGRVTIRDDQPTAQHDIATMARLNDPPDEAQRAIRTFESQQRVSFRFRPTSIHAEITPADHVDEG